MELRTGISKQWLVIGLFYIYPLIFFVIRRYFPILGILYYDVRIDKTDQVTGCYCCRRKSSTRDHDATVELKLQNIFIITTFGRRKLQVSD